jgi:hypothetical protein
MIKIAVEMVHKSNLTKEPCLRLIIFEAQNDPELQNTPWWIVKDIVEYEAPMIDDLVTYINTILESEECESVTLIAQEEGGARVEFDMTQDRDPSYIAPILISLHAEWIGRPIPPKVEKDALTKFTVVLWEQRRIEMEIDAANKDAAEDAAREAWHFLGDNDLDTSACSEVKFVDNREIKSMFIERKNQ